MEEEWEEDTGGKVEEEQQKELGSKNVKLTSFIIQLTFLALALSSMTIFESETAST